MLIAELQLVSSELDHWNNGCTGEHFTNFWNLEFEAENEQQLIQKMTAYFLCDSSYFQFNSCDEAGRIDVQLQTKDKFDTFPMSKHDLGLFMGNAIIGYLTTFSFQVFQQTIYTLQTESE
jgi:hypothetical protein